MRFVAKFCFFKFYNRNTRKCCETCSKLKLSKVEIFRENYRKTNAPESLFNKAASPQQFFTGDLFRNQLELSMVFGPVKKSCENVCISLKTKSKHEDTY